MMQKATLAVAFCFPFEPASASRPRLSKWGTYYAKPYRDWKKKAEDYCKAMTDAGLPPDTSLLVVVESVFTKARTSKLVRPTPDVDNTAKGPLDAITKSQNFYTDDKLVTWLISGKRFAAKDEAAGTHVAIYLAPEGLCG